MHRRIIAIKDELDALPELPANVEHEVKRSLFKFLDQVKTAISNTGFSSEWNTLNSQFQACVFKMKPTCKVKDSELQTIDISGGDSEVATPSPSKRPRPSDSTMRNVSTPTKRPRQTNTTTPIKNEEFATRSLSRASSVMGLSDPRSSPFARYHNLGRCAMDIKDIRNRILRTKRPGMPRDLVPDEVRETLCLDAVKKWEAPLDTYILKTAELLEKTANAALEESLGVLRRRLIFKDCHHHLKQFIEEAVASQRARLSDMFNSETYQLYMMNDEAFHNYKAQEMAQLLRVRGIIRLKALTLIDWDYPAGKLEEMSEEEKTKERKMLEANLPKIGKDPYDTEIEVAGFVRGYYMSTYSKKRYEDPKPVYDPANLFSTAVAAARFVEGVTMNVNSNLLRTFRERQLDAALDEKFHIYSHSGKSNSRTHHTVMPKLVNIANGVVSCW